MNTAGASPSCARQRRAARLTGSAQRMGPHSADCSVRTVVMGARSRGPSDLGLRGPLLARFVGDACRIEDAIGQELHPVG